MTFGIFLFFKDESMDLDPNYDPSDFLHMSSKKEPDVIINTHIKQEPQPQSQMYEQDTSFSMSEMLLYDQRTTTKSEHGQIQSESSEMTVMQSQAVEFTSQETYSEDVQSPQPNAAQNEHIDDVGIHDDLAISDSDEEQQQGDSTKNQTENANDNDADLWF